MVKNILIGEHPSILADSKSDAGILSKKFLNSVDFFFEEDDVTIFLKKVEETFLNEYNCHLYGKALSL